jgi:hypothetical protein
MTVDRTRGVRLRPPERVAPRTTVDDVDQPDGHARALNEDPGNAPGATRIRARARVDLYWIPLGAGAHVVRLSGRLYEGIKAAVEHRPRYALYHTALEVAVPDGRFVIESAPVIDEDGRARGVVAGGPVGRRRAGRFRLFRYEIRRWPGGSIPDADEAVGSPVRVASDLPRAQRLLELVPSVPTPVWGRDELRTGDMWNSNSLTSWLLAQAGVETADLRPPAGGRAPGWNAGLVVAQREMRSPGVSTAGGGHPLGRAIASQAPSRD